MKGIAPIILLLVVLATTIAFAGLPVPSAGSHRLLTNRTNTGKQIQVAQQWARTLGGSDNDYAASIATSNDGGYVIGGGTRSFGAGELDAWVLKLDEVGGIEWQKVIGGGGADGLGQVIATSDGKVVGTGCLVDCPEHPSSATWVFKLDESGSVMWNKAIGGAQGDTANGLVETTDKGYIVGAYSYSFQANGPHMWLFKLDINGNLVWQKGIAGGRSDHPYRIIPTPDGNLLVIGQTYISTTTKFAGWLTKIDDSGNLLWQKRYGGIDLDSPSAAVATEDGGFVIAGTSWSFGLGNTDGWIFKVDDGGSVVWNRVIGGGGFDSFGSLTRASDGGYVVVGASSSFGGGGYDAWILKLDENGNIEWQRAYGGGSDDSAADIVGANNGGYVVVGNSRSYGAGNSDLWVLKIDSAGHISPHLNNCMFASTPSATIISPTLAVLTTTYTTYDTNSTIAASGTVMTPTVAQFSTQCEVFNAYGPILSR